MHAWGDTLLVPDADAPFHALSFAFDTFESYHAAVRAIAMEAIDEENFGIDLALSQGQIARQDGVAAKAKVAKDLMRAAPSKLAGLKQLASMAVAGESAMRSGEWMHHFLIEGVDAAEAASKTKRLREILGKHGREIANSVPSFVHTLPFAPLTNVLGPKGERWVPLHGVLRHEDVVPFHYALQEFYAERAEDMERLGVWTGGMFTAVGQTGFLYEIAMYWPDERHAFHANMLEKDFLAKQPAYPANPEARAYVAQLKQDLVALYQKFGAAHFQLGRAYPYRKRLDPQAAALLAALPAAARCGRRDAAACPARLRLHEPRDRARGHPTAAPSPAEQSHTGPSLGDAAAVSARPLQMYRNFVPKVLPSEHRVYPVYLRQLARHVID